MAIKVSKKNSDDGGNDDDGDEVVENIKDIYFIFDILHIVGLPVWLSSFLWLSVVFRFYIFAQNYNMSIVYRMT